MGKYLLNSCVLKRSFYYKVIIVFVCILRVWNKFVGVKWKY